MRRGLLLGVLGVLGVLGSAIGGGCGGSGAPGTDDGGGGEVDASDEDVSLALPTAVTTFESIGLYWSDVPAPLDADDVDARVAYRVAGETAWRDGLPLWYDERDAQYRGSIVHLAPGTTYHVKLTLDSGAYRIATATTMAETFPIARTVELPELSTETLTITESGTADGYVLYTAAPGSTATIDVGKTADFDIVVAARYVIRRTSRSRSPRSRAGRSTSGATSPARAGPRRSTPTRRGSSSRATSAATATTAAAAGSTSSTTRRGSRRPVRWSRRSSASRTSPIGSTTTASSTT